MATAIFQKKAADIVIRRVSPTTIETKLFWSCFLGGKKSWISYAAAPLPTSLFSFQGTTSSHFAGNGSSLLPPPEYRQEVPPRLFYFGGSMELMAVPKKKVSPYKKGLRNGPKALKPVPVIVRCRSCGRVKLPHFYCCSGDRGSSGRSE